MTHGESIMAIQVCLQSLKGLFPFALCQLFLVSPDATMSRNNFW